MEEMYRIIEGLCTDRGIKIGTLCSELGISRGIMSNLKSGATKRLSAETVQRIADYFNVSADRLLGRTDEKLPALTNEPVSEEDIKIALFKGADEVTDEMWKEAQFAVQLIMDRHKREKDNK